MQRGDPAGAVFPRDGVEVPEPPARRADQPHELGIGRAVGLAGKHLFARGAAVGGHAMRAATRVLEAHLGAAERRQVVGGRPSLEVDLEVHGGKVRS